MDTELFLDREMLDDSGFGPAEDQCDDDRCNEIGKIFALCSTGGIVMFDKISFPLPSERVYNTIVAFTSQPWTSGSKS